MNSNQPTGEGKCPTCGNSVLYHNCGDVFHAPWKKDFPPSPQTGSGSGSGVDTPRTDAVAIFCDLMAPDEAGDKCEYMVPVDFARTLERELEEANKSAREWAAMHAREAKLHIESCNALGGERDALTAALAATKEALEEWKSKAGKVHGQIAFVEVERDSLRTALSSARAELEAERRKEQQLKIEFIEAFGWVRNPDSNGHWMKGDQKFTGYDFAYMSEIRALTATSAALEKAQRDGKLLDWVMRNVSGKALREAGIITDGSTDYRATITAHLSQLEGAQGLPASVSTDTHA